MTNVQNALSLINAAGQKKIDASIAKKKNKKDNITNLIKKIQARQKQIKNILQLGNAIISNDLISEYNQYTRDKVKAFQASMFYHQLGFLHNKNNNRLYLAVLGANDDCELDVLITYVNRNVVILFKKHSDYNVEYPTIDNAWPLEQAENNIADLEQRLLNFASQLN